MELYYIEKKTGFTLVIYSIFAHLLSILGEYFQWIDRRNRYCRCSK